MRKKKRPLSKEIRSRIAKDAIFRRLKWEIIDRYCIPSWDNGESIYSKIKQKRPKAVPKPSTSTSTVTSASSKPKGKQQADEDDDETSEEDQHLNPDRCGDNDNHSDHDDQPGPDDSKHQPQMVKWVRLRKSRKWKQHNPVLTNGQFERCTLIDMGQSYHNLADETLTNQTLEAPLGWSPTSREAQRCHSNLSWVIAEGLITHIEWNPLVSCQPGYKTQRWDWSHT